MNLKQILIKSHLILGLVSGIIVFIISVTGALYAFKDEIEDLTLDYKKVSIQDIELLLPSEAIEIGENANPGKEIHGILYQSPSDALEIIYYQEDPFFYGATYLNPYSGEVIKTVDYMRTFFGFVRRGHATLWIPNLLLGYTLVAIATIIFVVMLITGIILWWPRKRSSGKNFVFSKGDKPSIKRLERHKIVGFYISFFALLIALTGLSWLIKGLDKAMYKGMGGEKEIVWNPPLSDTTFTDSVTYSGKPIDVLFARIKEQYQEMDFIEMHIPHSDSASILVELNRDPSSHRKMDYLYFDQYTLEQIYTNNFYGSYDDAQVADKIKRSYYGIHSGGVLGLPGKFLAFFISLFCASLPVTGYLLWWNRRKEKKAFKNKLDF